jgi:hypothetical protein
MKLDQRTLQVLKNFSSINPSILFRAGNVVKTITPTKTILAKATLEQEFPSSFAIYDLNRFLSVLSLFDDPDLEIGEKSVVIRSGRKKVNYVFADPNTIVAPKDDKEIRFPAADVSFELTNEALADVTKALGVLRQPEIAVVGNGTSITLQTTNSKDPTSDVYSVEVGETDKTFNFIFKAENLRLLPETYTVDIASAGISRFTSKDVEYFIAIEANSKFDG